VHSVRTILGHYCFLLFLFCAKFEIFTVLQHEVSFVRTYMRNIIQQIKPLSFLQRFMQRSRSCVHRCVLVHEFSHSVANPIFP
jgi:hypothetical protein